jgi:acyl-homoserine-lactone acylase
MAWTHTVSAGSRMTGYNLTLDPASPTSYLVDGVSVPMTSSDVTVEILRADGTIDTETRTLWRSEYGPILDFPGIGWSTTNVFSYRDANIDNDEFIEQYARMPTVQSIADLQELTERFQGVPLFNTVAVDDEGIAWYADTSATPQLSDAAELTYIGALFSDPLTQVAYEQGFILLDGSNSLFRWEELPDARDPGLVPYAEMPMVERTDHVFNANDSFWVPNAEITLTGPYSLLHGEQNTPLTMRTRQNATVLHPANPTGLAGDDALFDAEEVRTAAFDNRGRTASLLRPAAVAACQAQPIVMVPDLIAADGSVSLPAATIDLTAACAVLAGWDGVYDLDRSGPIIWRETLARFDPSAFETAGPLFSDSFDPAQPARTPATPNPDPTALLQAMARAVQTITEAGFSVDTTLGASQFTERSEMRIPIHGGTGTDGVTNVVTWSDRSTSGEPAPERGDPVAAGSSLRGEGYRINYGTSFVMTVDFTGDEVAAWSLLVYGQTGDRTSDLFDSQMVAFSEKRWRQVAFTDAEIEADADLTTRTVAGR